MFEIRVVFEGGTFWTQPMSETDAYDARQFWLRVCDVELDGPHVAYVALYLNGEIVCSKNKDRSESWRMV